MKFSSTLPTSPGAYWWKHNEKTQEKKLLNLIVDEDFGLIEDDGELTHPLREYGLWCRLYPSDELATEKLMERVAQLETEVKEVPNIANIKMNLQALLKRYAAIVALLQRLNPRGATEVIASRLDID